MVYARNDHKRYARKTIIREIIDVVQKLSRPIKLTKVERKEKKRKRKLKKRSK